VLVVVVRLWLCVGGCGEVVVVIVCGCGEVVVVCWWLRLWCEVMMKSLVCQPPECYALKGEDTLQC
jgi:hypothetical protein